MVPREGAGFEPAVPQKKKKPTSGGETQSYIDCAGGPSRQMTKNRNDQVGCSKRVFYLF